MKVKELITELEKISSVYGEHEVCIFDNREGGYIGFEEVLVRKVIDTSGGLYDKYFNLYCSYSDGNKDLTIIALGERDI